MWYKYFKQDEVKERGWGTEIEDDMQQRATGQTWASALGKELTQLSHAPPVSPHSALRQIISVVYSLMQPLDPQQLYFYFLQLQNEFYQSSSLSLTPSVWYVELVIVISMFGSSSVSFSNNDTFIKYSLFAVVRLSVLEVLLLLTAVPEQPGKQRSSVLWLIRELCTALLLTSLFEKSFNLTSCQHCGLN